MEPPPLAYMTYSLRPKKSVVVSSRATSLTGFVENACNIYVSK
jgi:hypothetical protein